MIVYFYSGLSPLLNYKTLYSRICLFLSNFVSFPVLQVLDSQSVSVEDLIPKTKILNVET